MKLSALPATFGLSESSKKGYFPHFCNTYENQRYVGALPAIEFYGPDTMAPAERAAFLDWYENTSPGYIFDFQKEIVEYCQMDVEILRRACIVGETDPFIAACTIASACSYVFRKIILVPNTIEIIPPNGYRRADKHSQKSIEWLLHCEGDMGHEIVHAERTREFRLPEGQLVDGYLPALPSEEEAEAKGIIFEY